MTQSEKMPDIFQELYKVGHALMTTSMHYIVGNTLLNDPESFKNKSANAKALESKVKNKPTKKNVKKYVKSCLSFSTTTERSSNVVARDISALPSSSEDETPEPKRKRKSASKPDESSRRKKSKD